MPQEAQGRGDGETFSTLFCVALLCFSFFFFFFCSVLFCDHLLRCFAFVSQHLSSSVVLSSGARCGGVVSCFFGCLCVWCCFLLSLFLLVVAVVCRPFPLRALLLFSFKFRFLVFVLARQKKGCGERRKTKKKIQRLGTCCSSSFPQAPSLPPCLCDVMLLFFFF